MYSPKNLGNCLTLRGRGRNLGSSPIPLNRGKPLPPWVNGWPGVSFEALCRVHQWTVESLKGEPAGEELQQFSFLFAGQLFFLLFLFTFAPKDYGNYVYIVYGSLLLFLLNSNTGRHVRIQFPNKKEGWIMNIDARCSITCFFHWFAQHKIVWCLA